MDRTDRPLALLPDVETICDERGWVLRRDGGERYADDKPQAIIIEALQHGSCDIDALTETICEACDGMREDEAALCIARFILEFSEFLRG